MSLLLYSILFQNLTITTAFAATKEDTDLMTVTVTGEAKSTKELTSTVHVVTDTELKRLKPAHPSEVLNRQAGVHINTVGGEGHMTAIRQPISTDAAYLFLEDGLPTRPSGLFNHNALYEVNVPQAQRIEIIKGPGSALYGSESIGGVINTITPKSPGQFELGLNPEIGSDGWKRLLVSAGNRLTATTTGRVDFNMTDSQGYRDEAEYSREAVNVRLDSIFTNGLTSKTLLAISKVEQSGVDSLESERYQTQSRFNRFHNDVGRRDVTALRFSNEFTFELDSSNRFTFIPFFRDNQMDLMPSWMLTYDPNDRQYKFQSYGFIAKFRQKLSNSVEWVTGVDVDFTPSTYRETRLSPVIEDGIYTSTAPTGRVNYDFNADQLALSPYIHGEWQVQPQLRLTAGLRYNYFNVDYQDNLDTSVVQSQAGADRFTHFRPASQTRSFDSLSPKLGLVYALNDGQSVYSTYRHSFRAPAINTLFRSGSSTNTDELDPVKTNSFEIGTRGGAAGLNYDIALYHMVIKDDIVSIIDQDSLDLKDSNAGQTEHQGLEITLAKRLHPEWSVSLATSYSNQQYEDFVALTGRPAVAINFAGNDVPRAPKTLASASVRYEPLTWFGSVFELEWNHVGEYFTDETNTQTYSGHTTAQLLASYPLTPSLEIYGRINNLTDKVYSAYTSNQVGDPDLAYRPGNPRSFFFGVQYNL